MKVRNQKGFTLLELLVVVTILAVISGVVISSLGGQEERAGQGAASNAMAALEDGVRIFQVTEDRLPGDLESLFCADPDDLGGNPVSSQALGGVLAIDTPAADNTAYVFGGTSNVPGVGGGLAADYSDKIGGYKVTVDLAGLLVDSGIDTLRYVASGACDNGAGAAGTDSTIGTETIGDEDLVDYETPLLAFDSPLNEGLGFSAPVETGTPVAVLLSPQEIGADPQALVLVFGIGQSSQLVSGDSAILGKAPFEGNVGRDKYAHYAVAVQVCDDCAPVVGGVVSADSVIDTTAATLDAAVVAAAAAEELEVEVVAVLDADADFLLEEYAEFTGNSDE